MKQANRKPIAFGQQSTIKNVRRNLDLFEG